MTRSLDWAAVDWLSARWSDKLILKASCRATMPSEPLIAI